MKQTEELYHFTHIYHYVCNNIMMDGFFLLFVQEGKPESTGHMTKEGGTTPAPHPNLFDSNNGESSRINLAQQI